MHRLKKLWDELTCLMPMPVCSCGAAKEVLDLASFNKLIQFLMGLNDTYDHMRNQILVIDPMLYVNKAYSMVLRVEKQRDVHNIFPEKVENMTMLVKGQESRGESTGRGRGRTCPARKRKK